MFHKTVNNAWNLFNFSEQPPKNSVENPVSWFSIGRKLLFDRSNRNQTAIETSRNSKSFFFTIFDRSIQSFDQSKILIFKFSLRKFQNLKFHFMKPYSPNSNIIITTYPCIYLYIQQERDIKIEKEEVFLAALGQYSTVGPLSLSFSLSLKIE